jgi:hypothetical protein
MNIVELISVIAIVLSLLFVAYQIYQSNKIAKVTTEYEIRNNHSSSNEIAMSDPEFALLLSRLADPTYTMTDGEDVQALAFVLRTVNFWAAAGTAYENGMLTKDTYDFVLDDIRLVVGGMPALHPTIYRTLVQFPSLRGTKVIGFAEGLLKTISKQ